MPESRSNLLFQISAINTAVFGRLAQEIASMQQRTADAVGQATRSAMALASMGMPPAPPDLAPEVQAAASVAKEIAQGGVLDLQHLGQALDIVNNALVKLVPVLKEQQLGSEGAQAAIRELDEGTLRYFASLTMMQRVLEAYQQVLRDTQVSEEQLATVEKQVTEATREMSAEDEEAYRARIRRAKGGEALLETLDQVSKAVSKLIEHKKQARVVSKMEVEGERTLAQRIKDTLRIRKGAEPEEKRYWSSTVKRTWKQARAVDTLSSAMQGAVLGASVLRGNLLGVAMAGYYMRRAHLPMMLSFAALTVAIGGAIKALVLIKNAFVAYGKKLQEFGKIAQDTILHFSHLAKSAEQGAKMWMVSAHWAIRWGQSTDEVRKSMVEFWKVGLLTNDMMKAALNLSAAWNISLSEATSALTTAVGEQEGSLESLRQYGIVVEGVTNETDRLARATAVASATLGRFGTAAEDRLHTLSGALERVKTAVSYFWEVLTEPVATKVIVPVIAAIGNFVGSLAQLVEGLWRSKLVQDMFNNTLEQARQLFREFTPEILLLGNIIRLVVVGAFMAVQAALKGLLGLARRFLEWLRGLYAGLVKFSRGVKPLADLLRMLSGSFKELTLTELLQRAKELYHNLPQPIHNVINFLGDAWLTITTAIRELLLEPAKRFLAGFVIAVLQGFAETELTTENLREAIGRLGAIIQPLAEMFGLWLGFIAVTFAKIAIGIGETIGLLTMGRLEEIGPLWEGIFGEIGAHGEALEPAMARLSEELFASLMPATYVRGKISTAWQDVFSSLREPIEEFEMCPVDIGLPEDFRLEDTGMLEFQTDYLDLIKREEAYLEKMRRTDLLTRWEILSRKESEAYRAFFRGIVRGIKDWTENIRVSIRDWFGSVGRNIGDWFKSIGRKIKDFWGDIRQSIREAFQKIRERIGRFLERCKESLREGWRRIKEGASEAWEKFKEVITGIITNVISELEERLTEFVTAGTNLVTSIIEGIRLTAETLYSKARELIGEVIKAIKAALGIVRAGGDAINARVGGTALVRGIIEGIGLKWEALKTKVRALIGVAITAIRERLDVVVDKAQALYELGKSIVAGLIEGVRRKAQELYDAVRGTLEETIRQARGLLESGSPSKVFREMGESVVEGFLLGVAPLQDAFDSLTENWRLPAWGISVASLQDAFDSLRLPTWKIEGPTPAAPVRAAATPRGIVLNVYVTGNTIATDDAANLLADTVATQIVQKLEGRGVHRTGRW